MAAPDPSQVLGKVTLVTGPEEFLAERTVRDVRAAVRRADPEAELQRDGRRPADDGHPR